MTILVTGATGNIGGRVDHLIDLGANGIRSLTTNPAKAKTAGSVATATGYLGGVDAAPLATGGR